jgi:RNA polymerase sigma factor (sigma-70 family)
MKNEQLTKSADLQSDKKQKNKNKIQRTAQRYFANEISFETFYNELVPAAQNIARKFLKNSTDVDECMSLVFVKIYTNKNYTFKEDLSYFSWLYNTVRNQSLTIIGSSYRTENKVKIKKEIRESDICLSSNDEENIENPLSVYIHRNCSDVMQEAEIDDDIMGNMISQNMDMFKTSIENFFVENNYSDDERQIITDLLFSGEELDVLATEYNINSRITLVSRKRRFLKKYMEGLEMELNGEKFLNKEFSEGKIKLKYTNDNVKLIAEIKDNKINGEYSQFSKEGVLIEKGNMIGSKKHGKISYYKNNILTKEQHYDRGRKTGIWKRFYETGKTSELLNIVTGDFNLYNEEGHLEKIGVQQLY